MHQTRLRRYGHLGRKTGSHGLEKIPHTLDQVVQEHAALKDSEIMEVLHKMGFKSITIYNVRYRRKKLGIKKYLGNKCKSWVIKHACDLYGKACELCGYSLVVEVHHVIERKNKGTNEDNNLTVLCPCCHALITRKILTMKSRQDIPVLRETLKEMLRVGYSQLDKHKPIVPKGRGVRRALLGTT